MLLECTTCARRFPILDLSKEELPLRADNAVQCTTVSGKRVLTPLQYLHADERLPLDVVNLTR